MTHSLRTKQWRHILNSRNCSESAVSLLLRPFKFLVCSMWGEEVSLGFRLGVYAAESFQHATSSISAAYFFFSVGTYTVSINFLTLVAWILNWSLRVVKRDGENSKFDLRQVVTEDGDCHDYVTINRCHLPSRPSIDSIDKIRFYSHHLWRPLDFKSTLSTIQGQHWQMSNDQEKENSCCIILVSCGKY